MSLHCNDSRCQLSVYSHTPHKVRQWPTLICLVWQPQQNFERLLDDTYHIWYFSLSIYRKFVPNKLWLNLHLNIQQLPSRLRRLSALMTTYIGGADPAEGNNASKWDAFSLPEEQFCHASAVLVIHLYWTAFRITSGIPKPQSLYLILIDIPKL